VNRLRWILCHPRSGKSISVLGRGCVRSKLRRQAGFGLVGGLSTLGLTHKNEVG
jgi:hypothetical protein